MLTARSASRGLVLVTLLASTRAQTRRYSGRGGGGGGGAPYRRRAAGGPTRPATPRSRDDRGGRAVSYRREAAAGYDEWAEVDDGAAVVGDGGEYDGGEYLYGVSSVLCALQTGRRSATRLLLQDSMVLAKRKDAALVRTAERLAAEGGLPVSRVDKHSLNLLTRDRPHQGVVLQAEALGFEPMPLLPPPPSEGARAVWLALDEVSDPQNLGSLLRSALFLGAAGVLVSEKNSAPLTPAVSRASAGAMELLRVHSSRNLVRTLAAAREAGWLVAGAALEESTLPSQLDRERHTVLVLGSEGRGLRTSVLRECDAVVRVPRGEATAAAAVPAEQLALVDSLNVGVAGGVLLHELLHGGGG